MSEASATPVWPALTYESLPWQPSEPATGSRTALRRHRGPYQAAVAPAIADVKVLLPSEAAAAIDEAGAEIARFDAELGHEIAPFAAVLLRSESAASSKIENLTASARAIAEAELHGHASRNASLIVANERAMSAAIALASGSTATPSSRCMPHCSSAATPTSPGSGATSRCGSAAAT